jgi:hypothetical protein
MTMISQFKPGVVINIPVRRDAEIENVSAELLPKMIVSFYDGTNLAGPPVGSIATVEEAIRIVHERYPDAHYAETLDADWIRPVDDAMERDIYVVLIPFFPSGPIPDSRSVDAVGAIEWFVKLTR